MLGRRSFVTITGKAFRPNQHPPRARRLRAAVAWCYVALATVLPLIALLWAASSAFVTADIRLMRFTSQHFAYVLFDYPKTWLAVGNSVLLGILTASVVSLLGLAVSWIVLRARHRGRGLLDQLSMVPLSMPAMVFALGLLWVYVHVPLPIYGTIGILLIAYATHYLPFGVRATSAALRQLHPELEEAARVAGASWFRTMRRITLPLVQPAVLAAWVLLFVMAMQEVSSSILLYTSHSIVLSVAVFDLWENGNPSDVAALGFLQLIASSVIVGVRSRHAPAARLCMSSAVAVEALTVAHGSVPAVRDISFTARRGELLTLLGPSGCGKTTTLRAIAGLETPRQGRIAIGGHTVFDAARGENLAPERRGLAMVFQSYAIWPHMTVFENVAFGLRARGLASRDLPDAVRRSLDLVGLGAFADRPATRLSGGQQQRVALARSIAGDPAVILLDEPLSNLDAQLRLAMRAEFKALQRRLELTAIYVTHDQEEALVLSDRILVMRDGIIEQEGTPAEIHGAPKSRFVAEFVGVSNILPCDVTDRRTRRLRCWPAACDCRCGPMACAAAPASVSARSTCAYRRPQARSDNRQR